MWSAAAEKCIQGQGDLNVTEIVCWWGVAGEDRCCIQMWGNYSVCSPDYFPSGSKQPLPEGLLQKIVPLTYQNKKTSVSDFFHGKSLGAHIIQTVRVSSLLCFLALNSLPTFSRQDNWTQLSCIGDFLGNIHVINFPS